MANVRCSHCGLLNFADAAGCKRCKSALPEPPAEVAAVEVAAVEVASADFASADFASAKVAPAGAARAYAPDVRTLRLLVALALAAVAVFVAYSFRHRVWYGRNAEYAILIRDSEVFRAPITVEARRQTTNHSTGAEHDQFVARLLSDPVSVLEARGLVRMMPVKTGEELAASVPVSPGWRPSGPGDPGQLPTYRDIMRRYETTSFEVTPAGREAAADWKEQKDGDDDTWLVPIGRREVYGIHSVYDASREADGTETRKVFVRWRWVPNDVGKAFDVSGWGFSSLPDKGRLAAEAMKFSSAEVYLATACLERRAGGEWVVKRLDTANDPKSRTGAWDFPR
jgi:hypothetical protein